MAGRDQSPREEGLTLIRRFAPGMALLRGGVGVEGGRGDEEKEEGEDAK